MRSVLRSARHARWLAAVPLLLGVGVPGAQSDVATAESSVGTTPRLADKSSKPLLPPRGEPWFGPDLDWDVDTSQSYTRRLGVRPSMIGRSVEYPLSDSGAMAVRDLARRSSTAGAVAVLTLTPTDLRTLTPKDARRFVGALRRATAARPAYFLLRFGPEMNGSWTAWGLRPRTYVGKFRELARVVHASNVEAAMVWTPAYGAGYPFSRALNAATSPTQRVSAPAVIQRNRDYLDTNSDGVVNDGDDPYGPYYPGDTSVDWVGLTVLRYGSAPSYGDNTVPRSDELDARFKEQFGYGSLQKREPFYVRFAGRRQQPFLLTTGAMYNPARSGASQLAIKRAWLDQTVEASTTRRLLAGIQWLEQDREEPEIGNVVSWKLSQPPSIATALRADFGGAPLTLAPLDLPTSAPLPVETDPSDPADAPPGTDGQAPAASPGTPSAGPPESDRAWINTFAAGMVTTLLIVLTGAFAVWRARRRRMVPPWLR